MINRLIEAKNQKDDKKKKTLADLDAGTSAPLRHGQNVNVSWMLDQAACPILN